MPNCATMTRADVEADLADVIKVLAIGAIYGRYKRERVMPR